MGLARVLAERGHFGVDVFFVLSGFLITGVLLKSRTAENFYSVFYARRALRIWPVYYVTLAAVFLSGVILGSVYPWYRQIWYWLNLSNWPSSYGENPTVLTHFWSLAIEEQFYLVWPLLVRRLSIRSLIVISAVMVPLEFALRLLPAVQYQNFLYQEFINRTLYLRADGLFLGSLLALLVWQGVLTRSSMRQVWTVLALSLGVVGFLMVAWTSSVPVLRSLQYTAWSFLAAAIIAAVTLDADGPLSRAFAVRPLRLLGRVSYCFYVAQIPLLVWVHHYPALLYSRTMKQFFLFPVAFFLLVFGVSLLSWYLLEHRRPACKGSVTDEECEHADSPQAFK